jgi:hypothetical protein
VAELVEERIVDILGTVSEETLSTSLQFFIAFLPGQWQMADVNKSDGTDTINASEGWALNGQEEQQ